ncbi:MAG TPA: flagellar export protein FliJ [Gallionella sp.]|nr:flagellar export protein FliJ [Gallionella sp.]
MTKPFTLQPLINLAQHQNDSATRKLGQLNKQQLSAQSKLDMLQQYRKDYQARLQAATQNGINPAELRNFQEFMSKLDEAISQQLKLVGQSRLSTQAGRGEFNTAQRKLKSFEVLQQRHTETQNIAAAKSEQTALDEHTGRFATYKATNSDDHS